MKKSLCYFLLLMSLCVLAQVDVEQRGNSPNDYALSLDCRPLSNAALLINHSSTVILQTPLTATYFDVGLPEDIRRATS